MDENFERWNCKLLIWKYGYWICNEIEKHRKKVEKTAKDKEEKSIELAKKIQQMNGAMQAAAVEAAKAAAQQASA